MPFNVFTWIGPNNGTFNVAANWTNGTVNAVPVAGDEAQINVADTVDMTATNTIDSISTVAGAVLAISAGDALYLQGAVASSNAGQIQLNGSGGSGAGLVVDGATLTLTGGGSVALNNDGNNFISAAASGDELINVNNTISGAGAIGGGNLVFLNDAGGTVDAVGNGNLVLNTGTSLTTNDGLLEATSGQLIIQSRVDGHGGGTIDANGDQVLLNSGGTVAGGTLTSTAGSSVEVNGSATLDGSAHTVTNIGSVVVDAGQVLTLLGTYDNTTATQLNGSGGSGAELLIGSGTVTLTGGGTVSLNNDGNNAIVGAAASDKLVNNETIVGAGQIGGGTLTLTNSAAGVINGSGNNNLVINTGTNAVSNSGLIEETGGNTIFIESVVSNGTAGVIDGGNGAIALAGGDLQGGTLKGTSGGIIETGSGNGTLDGSAHQVVNDGSVVVNPGQTLTLLGTYDNTTTTQLNGSGGSGAFLIIGSSTVTLNGAGTVSLNNDGNNEIVGASASDTLVNNETIAGAGQIGVGSLTLTNSATGVIEGTGNNNLVINTGANTVGNSGLIEEVGGNAIYIESVVNNGTAGVIDSGNGAIVLAGGDIEGGTLKSTSGGNIQTGSGNGTLDGSAHAVVNDGTVIVNPAQTLTLLGSIDNTAVIDMNGSGGSGAFLEIGGTPVTLYGGGTLSLNNDINNAIFGAAASDVLVNDETIVGAGQLGGGALTFTNSATGTIDGTGNNDLIVNVGAGSFTNDGLIEETGGNVIYLEGTIANASGVISAGTGAVVINNGTIQGGTIESTVGGNVQTGGTVSVLDGSVNAVVNDGSVQVNPGQTLTVLGSIDNNGVAGASIFLLGSGGSGAHLLIGTATFTLGGGGALTLDNDINNTLAAATSGDEFVNVKSTISGAGTIGTGGLVVLNDAAGTIDAVGNNNLILNAGSLLISNDGLLEATSGELVIQSRIDQSGGGTIDANGAQVILNGGTVAGGTLNSIGGNAAEANANSVLDGSTQAITNLGSVQIDPAQTLTVLGSLDNVGSVYLFGSGGSGAVLLVGSSTLTLGGGGTVTLDNDSNNEIRGAAASDTLVNVNDTIVGAGQLGAGTLTLTNDAAGVIEGNGNNNLVLNTGTNVIINDGLIKEIGGNAIYIQSVVNDTGGGTVDVGNGIVYLNGGTIRGGVIADSGGGSLQADGGSTLDGSSQTVLDSALTVAGPAQTLTLLGTISNGNTIQLNGSGGSGAELLLGSATVTLTGGGTVALNNDSNNSIAAGSGTHTLVNVNNTIIGAGSIGGSAFAITNDAAAAIIASGNNNLVINTGSKNLTNAGLVEADGAILTVQTGTVTNTGTFAALNGNLTFDAAVVNKSLSAGKLTGTWSATGGTLSITGGSVVTDSGNIILGAGGVFQAGTGGSYTNVQATLTTISAKSSLQVLGGANFSASSAITDDGSIDLGGGTFSTSKLTVAKGANLTGSGVLSGGTLVNSGLVAASGGVLSLTADTVPALTGGVITGGTWEAENGGTLGVASAITVDNAVLILSGAGSEIGVVSGPQYLEQTLTTIQESGQLQILGGRNYTVGVSKLTDSGTITLGGGTLTGPVTLSGSKALLSGSGTLSGVTNAGGAISATTGNFVITGLTGTGTLKVASGDVLDLQGSANVLAGSVSGSAGGTVELDGGTTKLGNTFTVTAATFAMANGATLDLSGHSLSAKGPATLGGVIDGAGTATMDAATTVSALTVGGKATLSNAATGTLTQSGSITLGDANGYGKLSNAGTYDLGANGIGVSGSGNAVTNSGLFDAAAGSGGTDTVSAPFTNAATGTIEVDSGTLDLASTATLAGSVIGAGSLEVGGSATVKATLNVSASSMTFAGGLNNSGTIVENGGTLFVDKNPSGTGTIEVENHGVASYAQSGTNKGAFTFLDGTGTLDIAQASGFGVTINGMVLGDTIDLVNLPDSHVTGYAYNTSTDMLALTTTTGTDSFHIVGSYTMGSFNVGPDHATGTAITL